MAIALFLVGLLAACAAVVGLAGPWWGLLLAGVVCAVLGVLTYDDGPTKGAKR